MSNVVPLSALTEAVTDALHWYFDGKIIKVKAEITDVKKYPYKKWCFLKLVEKQGTQIIAEFKGLVWHQGYAAIMVFEEQTGQKFEDGIEIICDVKVNYSSKFGLSLEIIDIDTKHTIGSLVLEKEATLKKLLLDYPQSIKLYKDEYYTFNNQQAIPLIIRNIALITAANSDGERDFKQELLNNKYGFAYHVDSYLCTIQGATAANNMMQQLDKISKSKIKYDVVVIVRGGGSNTDFKPFDDFSLSLKTAQFSIPILTGIGHDRNSSIVDLMTRPFKTPTKVANYIVEQTMYMDAQLDQIKQRIDYAVEKRIHHLTQQLQYIDRILHQANFDKTLARGFAVVYKNNQVITDTNLLSNSDSIEIHFKDKIVLATVNKISKYGKRAN